MPGSFNILLVVGSLNQGGAEFQLLSLANLLQSKGHQVEVLALTDYDYFLPYVKEHNIKYSCVTNNGNNFDKTRRAIKAINDKKPDLVISYIKKVSQVAIAARIISGFRFKLIISERTSLVKPLHDLFYFNLANFANKITVNSVSKLSYIRRRFFLLKTKAVFVPNIINLDKFNQVQNKIKSSTECNISYVGRISPEKNLLNLILAVEALQKKGYQLKLALYGTANNKTYLAEVADLITTRHLENLVQYKGPAQDVATVYAQTDLLCLVSIFEGFSNVLSEAISSGVPVVASNIEENRYLIEDGINGFLADPHHVESIAVAIERVVNATPQMLSIMSANNKAKAAAIFDKEKIYQTYLNLFKELGFKFSSKITTQLK